MKLFKNGVGRPSNETKQLRQVFVVSVSAIVISVVALLVSLITNTNIKGSKLKGNATDERDILGDVCGSRVNTKADGKVDVIDAVCIFRFASQTKEASTTQKKNADLNNDGKITAADARLAVNSLKEKFKKGDMDFDGHITSNDAYFILQYSSKTLKYSDELKLIYDYFADVNEDGKITAADARQVLKSGFLVGDANGDGKVSKTDAKCMLAYQSGFHNQNADFCGTKIENGTNNWYAADINGDGTITSTDAAAVFGIMADGHRWGDANGDGKLSKKDMQEIINLSASKGGKIKKGDKEYKIYLDLNFDNKINSTDATILNYVINAKKGKYGDLNSDGKLNRKDAKKYVNALVNANFKTKDVTLNADANRDKKANNKDMYLLLAIDIARHGDINRDNEITSEDTRVLYRYLDGLKTKDEEGNEIKVNKTNADLNYDGIIDDDDIALLKRYVTINISKND